MTPAVQSMVAATYVRDIDTSRAFYELLGFHEQSAGNAATSAWSALHHNGHAVLLASTQPPLGIPRLPLLFYFYFDELDAVVSVLDAASVEVTRVGHPPHALGGEVKIADPDGNTVLLGQLERSASQVPAADDGMCRIGAEQRERVLAAQLVPHRLDLDGSIDEPVIPEQRDHLAIEADWLPGPGRLPDQRADSQPETSRIGPVGDDEPAHRLAGVEREIGAAHLGCRDVDAGLSEPSFEQEPVSRRGDHDRRAVLLDSFEKVLAHPPGEPVIVLVEQNNMITRTSTEDISPRSHGFPVQERHIPALQGSS